MTTQNFHRVNDQFLRLLRGQVTQEDADDILRTLMAIGLTVQTAATVANTLLCAQVLEPFGYFKPEPFGWTDCAADDDGAIALYEHPAAPDAWRDAVLEQLESWHIYVPSIHDNSPRLALKALVRIETQTALDPSVSSQAAALASKEAEMATNLRNGFSILLSLAIAAGIADDINGAREFSASELKRLSQQPRGTTTQDVIEKAIAYLREKDAA